MSKVKDFIKIMIVVGLLPFTLILIFLHEYVGKAEHDCYANIQTLTKQYPDNNDLVLKVISDNKTTFSECNTIEEILLKENKKVQMQNIRNSIS